MVCNLTGFLRSSFLCVALLIILSCLADGLQKGVIDIRILRQPADQSQLLGAAVIGLLGGDLIVTLQGGTQILLFLLPVIGGGGGDHHGLHAVDFRQLRSGILQL